MTTAAPQRKQAAARRGRRAAAPVRRWMVSAFCPMTGPWREIVHAATAAGALAKYCAEHDMPPTNCHVRPD